MNQTQAFTPIIHNSPPPSHPQQPLQSGYVQRPAGSHGLALGIVLHFLITGTGQAYNGQFMKGALIFLSVIVTGCLFFPIAIFIWFLALADMIVIAIKLNKGITVGKWETF